MRDVVPVDGPLREEDKATLSAEKTTRLSSEIVYCVLS